MVNLLQIGSQTVTSADIIPLLVQYQLLPQLVREVSIDQAIAEIVLSEDETSHGLEQFLAAQGLTDSDSKQQGLKRLGLTESQLMHLATRSQRIQRFKEQQWGSGIEADFLNRKAQLDQVTYSLLRTQHPEIAQELYFRIHSGEQEFEELASEYSEGSEAETGGRIGPVSLEQAHPAMADRLRQNKPGYIFPPISIDSWYVLIRLEEFRPAQLNGELRQTLLDQRFEDWINTQLQNPIPMPNPISTPIPIRPLVAAA